MTNPWFFAPTHNPTTLAYDSLGAGDTNDRAPGFQAFQLPGMDRGESAVPEASSQQQAAVRSQDRNDRADRRRSEPAGRLSRRSGGGVLLSAQGRHDLEYCRKRKNLRRQ